MALRACNHQQGRMSWTDSTHREAGGRLGRHHGSANGSEEHCEVMIHILSQEACRTNGRLLSPLWKPSSGRFLPGCCSEQMNDYGLNGKLFEWGLCPCLWESCAPFVVCCMQEISFQAQRIERDAQWLNYPHSCRDTFVLPDHGVVHEQSLMLEWPDSAFVLRTARESGTVFRAKDLPFSNRLQMTNYSPTVSLSEQLPYKSSAT